MLQSFPRTFRPGDTPPVAARPDRPAVTALRPLTPADYLQLRRRAAGLSIEQVASRLVADQDARHTAVDLIRSLETPGIRARRPGTLERLRSIFAFDPDVYRQLAAEPADRHPRICRGCGGSRFDTDNGCGGTAPAGTCEPSVLSRGSFQ